MWIEQQSQWRVNDSVESCGITRERDREHDVQDDRESAQSTASFLRFFAGESAIGGARALDAAAPGIGEHGQHLRHQDSDRAKAKFDGDGPECEPVADFVVERGIETKQKAAGVAGQKPDAQPVGEPRHSVLTKLLIPSEAWKFDFGGWRRRMLSRRFGHDLYFARVARALDTHRTDGHVMSAGLDAPPPGRVAVQNLFPDADLAVVDALARVWDEVVRRIVEELMEMGKADEPELHINVREDMVLEIAQLHLFLIEAVIKKRTAGRELASIDPVKERVETLGPEGVATVTNTAKLFYEQSWRELMVKRWGPRSKRALEREANPPKTTLPIKPVDKNHFIPKWLIREHWARDSEVTIWRRGNSGWSSRRRGFGKWGHRPNLYSDRLEAYLSLLEGDAREPLQMLLDMRPLNQPQRASWIGFLVVQVIRNPFFIEMMHAGHSDLVAELAEDKRPTARELYETLYDNNEFYDTMARPLMWSRWAIVKSEAPLFVLPDTFCAQGGLKQDFRIIAPLTPRACFVTLQSREEEKRIIPLRLTADAALAARISGVLMKRAKVEFLADPEFDPAQATDALFDDVLRDIEAAIDAMVENPRME